GFLPQNAELSPGTIADNIARLETPDAEKTLSAARMAGAEAMILSLPHGFETPVGENGALLSAGQRRRIALARALYGAPSLVVLAEPDAHLDRDGEIALAGALRELKAAGAAVLICADKPSVLSQADKAMVLRDGRIAQFGPASEILAALSGATLR